MNSIIYYPVTPFIFINIMQSLRKIQKKLFFIVLDIILLYIFTFFLASPNLIFAYPKNTSPKKNIIKSKIYTTQKKNISTLNDRINKAKTITKKTNQKKAKAKLSQNKTSKLKSGVKTKDIFQILKCDTLTDGVIYKNIKMGKGRQVHSVHILEVDIENKNICVEPLKAGKTNYDLRKLHDIINSINQNNQVNVVGAINGSFWRAYNNFPIGITVINHEIVELLNHKNWSNALFDEKGKIIIDRVTINGKVKYKKNILAQISSVNRRRDSIGVVVYNKYGGDTIPFVQKEKFEVALKIALSNEVSEAIFEDSTEEAFDTLKFKQDMLESQRNSMLEFSLKKIALKYITNPAINSDINCLVIKVDTGCVAVPDSGCVISLGVDYDNFLPKFGDTLILRYDVNKYPKNNFLHIISATPRLVRNGIAKHEAYEEGSRGRRFINKALPRTAIGINRGRNTIYLVAVEGTKRIQGTIGASLSQLASIMKKIGCYNAMNLDGGGSSTMVINNKNVLYNSNSELSRRISIGIGVVEK